MKPVAWMAMLPGACLIVAATGAYADSICSSGYASGGGWLIEADTSVSPNPHVGITADHKMALPVTAERQSPQAPASFGKFVAVDSTARQPE